MRNAAVRPNWALFFVGLIAFLIMAVTVITQAVPPPIPESVSPLAAILILGGLLIALAALTAFCWEVLSADSGTSVDTAHVETHTTGDANRPATTDRIAWPSRDGDTPPAPSA
jgi:hypothetical protein